MKNKLFIRIICALLTLSFLFTASGCDLLDVIGLNGCSHVYTQAWKYDKDNHWIICDKCNESTKASTHTFITIEDQTVCSTCSYVKVEAKGEISFHFMMLGNSNAGDSIYIKAGENDILIDAGSRENSIDDIKN